ncbi:MLP-like protein 328 [Cucurbita moschata]|uniref:MLP-like protein 328 n=1 Tax=Cucurbita moschata TaxID=3662 RepID=A0A6J1FPH8_CUCMO|nr:MLP-like protein 328 [Cucurbita moschata]
MPLVEELSREVEIKAAATEFYNIFTHHSFNLPNISQSIQKVEVHDSIKFWYYTVDGKAEIYKEREEFDDDNLLISMIGVGGDVFKYYKAFDVIFQVIPKGLKLSSVILRMKYGKLDHNSPDPDPDKYVEFLNNLIKDIGSHLKDK